MRNRRTLRLIMALLVLLFIILAYFVVLLVGHHKLSKLSMQVIPTDSQLKLDGKKIQGKTLYVSPGTHTAEASKNGFTADSQTILVTKKGPNNVYLAPTPATTEALQWASNNPALEIQREKYAQIQQNKYQDTLLNKYPFLKYLPIETSKYVITYGRSVKYPDDPSHLAIFVHADTPGFQGAALDRLNSLGVDTPKQEIIYKKLLE